MADEIDSRMEQIRLKNEELEKKHKEILEDELEAKKQGAILRKEKAANAESKHPYDDLELDFDVKDEEKQHSKNPNYKPKNVRKPALDKKYLDEIPPDPVNFLREEVDGDESKKSSEPRPPQQQQQNNNRNRRNPRPQRVNNQGEKPEAQPANGNNSEGRPRQPHQNNPRSRPYPQSNRGAQDQPNSQNSPSPRKFNPQALRTERRALSSDANEETAVNKEGSTEISPTSSAQASRPRRPIQKQQQRPTSRDGNNERNNLTVNITDEVRSVKIKPTERVGSGRVGHGIQAENLSSESPEKPQSGDGNRNRNRNPRNKRTFKPKSQPNPEFQHPILDKIVITKTSVQERILRSQKSEDVVPAEPKILADAQPATPEIIEGSK